MKTTINVKTEVEIKTLHVSAKVRYWEDGTLNGKEDKDGEMPCRDGDNWCPIIDIDSGKILNWKQGTTAEIHYKVCDCCYWELKDEKGNTLTSKDGYVPGTLAPKEAGYGDYIIMDIDEDGLIADWDFDLEDFSAEDDDE
jgi:hypothetical protein